MGSPLACHERGVSISRAYISFYYDNLPFTATLQNLKQIIQKSPSSTPPALIDHITTHPTHLLPTLLILIPKSLLDRLRLLVLVWLMHLQPIALGEILARAGAALASGTTALCCVGVAGGGLGAGVGG